MVYSKIGFQHQFVLLLYIGMKYIETAHRSSRNEKTVLLFSPSISIILSFFLVILAGALVVNMVKSISVAYQRNLLLVQAEQDVDALRMRNLELLEKLDYVSSLAYVEQEARDQLQYTKDGETMVLLPDSGGSGDSKVLGEIDSDDGQLEEETSIGDQNEGLKRWWNLLVNGV